METINERIALVIANFANGNQREFGRLIQISSPSVHAFVKSGMIPSYATLQRILTVFPTLSPDWLLLGKGGMLREAVDEHLLDSDEKIIDMAVSLILRVRDKGKAIGEFVGKILDEQKTHVRIPTFALKGD